MYRYCRSPKIPPYRVINTPGSKDVPRNGSSCLLRRESAPAGKAGLLRRRVQQGCLPCSQQATSWRAWRVFRGCLPLFAAGDNLARQACFAGLPTLFAAVNILARQACFAGLPTLFSRVGAPLAQIARSSRRSIEVPAGEKASRLT